MKLALATPDGPRRRIDLAAIEAELKELSPDELGATFFNCLGGAVELLARAAVCVKIMEDRGMSLPRTPQIGTFKRIAYGQVLPELAWEFSQSPGRQLFERLSLRDQEKLVADPVLPVVEPAPGGGYDVRRVDLRTASREIARQVVGDEGLRSPDEQKVYLASTRRPAPAPAAPAHEVAKEPLTKQVTIKLTDSEYNILAHQAIDAGKSAADIARRWLVMSGVFEKGNEKGKTKTA